MCHGLTAAEWPDAEVWDSEMAKLFGAQRLVLQAIHDLPKDAAGFVTDAQVAQRTSVALKEVRDWIETLEGEEYVNVARTQAGLRVLVTAKGRAVLNNNRPRTADSHSLS